MARKVKDLSGGRYGKLVVLEYVGMIKRRSMFKCKCDCGKITITQGQLLKSGKTRSCGCLAVKNCDQTTHGLSKTHIYGVWCTMKSRCFNANSQHYKLYGGRGITVCAEWQEFAPFYEWAMNNGYTDNLTLDRIDVNGNYEPNNCRWTTQKKQCNNKRNNSTYTYNGETMTLHDLSEKYGIKYGTLWSRINISQWSVEKAISTP